MAIQPVLRLPLRNCGDLLLARHKARQVAQLLGFGKQEATEIAAATFVVVSTACQAGKRCCLNIVVADGMLRMIPETTSRAPPLILERALPKSDHKLSDHDLAFALRQLERIAPVTPRAELDRLNQELLELIVTLRDSTTRADRHSAA